VVGRFAECSRAFRREGGGPKPPIPSDAASGRRRGPGSGARIETRDPLETSDHEPAQVMNSVAPEAGLPAPTKRISCCSVAGHLETTAASSVTLAVAAVAGST
jgi:hypothetical protein